jgi:hypothetical protein
VPEKRYVPDSWTPHELPVLIAIAEWDEATSNDVLSLPVLTERMGREPNAIARVAKAVDRLNQAGYINARENTAMSDPYPDFMILGLSPLGLEAVGAWPRESDDLVNVFLRVLESQAHSVEAKDPDGAAKIRAFAKYVASAGMDVAKSVVTAVITHQVTG